MAVNKEAECVKTIQTKEDKLAAKKKELENFQGCTVNRVSCIDVKTGFSRVLYVQEVVTHFI